MDPIVFNVAKGRAVELYRKVDAGDPSTSRLLMVVIDRGATTDATLKDLDTLAAVLAVSTERNTNGWTRKTITSADIGYTVDDVNDWVNLDIPDQTWTSVTSGASTDVVVCYTPDSAGTDSTVIPLSIHPFAITPAGADVTAVVASAGFYRAD